MDYCFFAEDVFFSVSIIIYFTLLYFIYSQSFWYLFVLN